MNDLKPNCEDGMWPTIDRKFGIKDAKHWLLIGRWIFDGFIRYPNLDEWAFIVVADVIRFAIPILKSSAQCPTVSTLCIVNPIRKYSNYSIPNKFNAIVRQKS